MRLRRLEIERFRCVHSLDWRLVRDTVALVGPGDTGKSTVLEAVERVLSPRWNHPFDDTDFYNLDTSAPLRIRATIVDFPASFLKDSKFGLALQTFNADSGEAGPPTGSGSDALCVVVELAVDASLEPQWNVVDSNGETHPIHVRDRESLGMLRVGANTDLHLGWNRGSILTRLTESGDDVGMVLAEAMRKARAGLAVGDLDRLKKTATAVEALCKEIGATVRAGLVPHLDVGALAFSGSSLSLHDGAVPLRRSGLGSRRLMAIAMQHHAAGSDGVTLVDEFEHGLEPHRVRQLLRKLRGGAPEPTVRKTGQLMLTTHSPVVLSELLVDEIAVLRRHADGTASVVNVAAALKAVVSRTPSALVARAVIVAEGPTEIGLLRAIEEVWGAKGTNFAYLGIAVVNGEGDNAPAVAGHLVDLGIKVALFMDQDKAGAKLSRAKTAVRILWRSGRATENAVIEDLSEAAFEEVVQLAHRGREVKQPPGRCIGAVLANRVGKTAHEVGEELGAWRATVPELRRIFGEAAKDKGWFKTLDLGYQLGRIVARDLPNILDTDLVTTLGAVRAFAEHE